jgi:hypothetical protein
MKLNDRTYDWLKWICCILLPAIGTFYVAMAGTWGLPYAEEISKTTQALALFIGALIGISSAQYYKDR